MQIKEHLAKAERFIRSARKLDPQEDYEAILWARMHIGSNWLCAALHALKMTPPEDDVAHTWWLYEYGDRKRFEAYIDQAMVNAFKALGVFESTRQSHIRGPGPYGPEVLKLSDEAYHYLKEYAEKTVGHL